MPVPVANLLAEIRALTRDGTMPGAMISELQRRLEEVRDPLQGHTVVAMALLASAKGERKHARELMESVWWLDARALAPETIEYAQGWLVTDAAAEGEWKRVLSFLAEAPDTPPMRLFEHLASRVLHLSTTRPLATDDRYQLPTEARTFADSFKVDPPLPSAPSTDVDPMTSVLRQLLRLKETDAHLPIAAREVSALLQSRRLRDHLMERCTLIGGSSPDEVLEELRTIFERALSDALIKLEGDEPLLKRMAALQREALVEKLHERSDRLTDACSDGTAPPMPEVWREFVAIRSCYARAVALSEPGERGWPHHVLLRLTRYFGTWLRLTKRQLPFAYAVFHFLEVEGAHAGDDASARLAKASAELCLPFKLTVSSS